MSVRHLIPQHEGMYFITFTCYDWLPLFEITNGHNLVYKQFPRHNVSPPRKILHSNRLACARCFDKSREDMRLHGIKALENKGKFVFSDTQGLLRRDFDGEKITCTKTQ